MPGLHFLIGIMEAKLNEAKIYSVGKIRLVVLTAFLWFMYSVNKLRLGFGHHEVVYET